jgi:dihydroflavonol-4-reductase
VKIAVTGASGFIGTVLVPLLQDAGHELRLLTRDAQKDSSYTQWTAGNAQWTPGDTQGYAADADIDFQTTEWIRGDMLNKERLQQLVAGADAVIHLAAMISMKDGSDEKLIEVNVTGTRLLAEAAKEAGVERFIHVSSAAAYEQAPYDQPLDENKKLVQSAKYSYPYSKAVSQQVALEYNNTRMAVLVLAPTAVLGPYDHEPSLLGGGILKFYRGSIPAVFSGGVDMVDVRDVAGAIASALFHGTPGSTYLLSGHFATLSQVNQLVCDVKGKTKKLPVLPLWPILAALPVLHAWSTVVGASALYTRQSVDNLLYSNRKIDHAKARRELGYHPRPLSETIRDTISWFKKRGDIR